MSRLPGRLAAGACLPAMLLLAGCGGAAPRAEVASLPTHGGSAARHSAVIGGRGSGIPDPDGRPRLSLDATKVQQIALADPYQACLVAHHVSLDPDHADSARADSCLHLEPLPPWQLDPSNPQARAFIGRTVSCLDSRGYQASARMVGDVPDVAPEWYVTFSNGDLHDGAARLTSAEDSCREKALS